MPLGRKESKNRRGDFTEEPEDGWLHDETALAMGRGFFYTFPLIFLGSVKITHSLSNIPVSDRTLAVREMMLRLMEETDRVKPKKRKVKTSVLPFSQGVVTAADIPVSLGISADGMVVLLNLPNEEGSDAEPKQQQLFFHKMPMISIAAGGSGVSYDLVSYVAKDSTGNREAYIFDCGELSDEVLATLGQSFRIAQDIAANKKAKPETQQIKKEYLDVDAAIYESAEEVTTPNILLEQAEYDTAEVIDNPGGPKIEPDYEHANDVSSAAGAIDNSPIYEMAASVAPVPEQGATYDNQGGASKEEPIYDFAVPDKEKIVRALNKRDTIRRTMKASKKKSKKGKPLPPAPEPATEDLEFNNVEITDLSRPSWVCISEAGEEQPQVDLGSLLAQFKRNAVSS